MNRWRVGRSVGRTLYCGDVLVGMVDTPELATELVVAANAAAMVPEPPPSSTSTRVDEPRPGGGSRWGQGDLTRPPPTDVVIVDATPPPVSPKGKPMSPPIPRTESAAQRSLFTHYRRIFGEETQAIRAIEEELLGLKKDPKVIRYLEAVEALSIATTRREQAARDLGFAVCNERETR